MKWLESEGHLYLPWIGKLHHYRPRAKLSITFLSLRGVRVTSSIYLFTLLHTEGMGWKEGGKKKVGTLSPSLLGSHWSWSPKKRGRAMSQLECRRSCPPVTTGGNCSLLFPPLSSFPHLIVVISERIKKNLTTKGHHHPRPRSCPRYKFHCRGQHEQFHPGYIQIWSRAPPNNKLYKTINHVVTLSEYSHTNTTEKFWSANVESGRQQSKHFYWLWLWPHWLDWKSTFLEIIWAKQKREKTSEEKWFEDGRKRRTRRGLADPAKKKNQGEAWDDTDDPRGGNCLMGVWWWWRRNFTSR